MNDETVLRGLIGLSGDRQVIMGFAPANVLYAISFADVLDESDGTGYQRRPSEKHSLDFRGYIQKLGSSTIPLTFNLRPAPDRAWSIETDGSELVQIRVSTARGPALAQVDCQHRLGHIGDLAVSLPFMIFVGLDAREELEIFSIINSKAKGLSGSLIDFHESQLTNNLGKERPELLIALHLHDQPDSPWYKQLDLGGKATSGMKRRASLRTMQKAVKRFLACSDILDSRTPGEVAAITLEFWSAVAQVLPQAWAEPRTHFLTKGIGVYALMGLLGDLWIELRRAELRPDRRTFAGLLSDFAPHFDWSSRGPLRGLGGESGAAEALELLRSTRGKVRLTA